MKPRNYWDYQEQDHGFESTWYWERERAVEDYEEPDPTMKRVRFLYPAFYDELGSFSFPHARRWSSATRRETE